MPNVFITFTIILFNGIITAILGITWIAGFVIAKGFWSTFFCWIPFYAWYLVIQHIMLHYNLI